MGHFARECKGPRNQESRDRNQDSSRRTVNVEDIYSQDMMVIDGVEKLKKEKESNQIKIDNFENASKSLDKLIRSQIFDNNRKGVGYNVVPPPPTGLFAPPTIDLSNSGLKEFQRPEFEGYGLKENKSVYENSSNEIKKTTDAPIIKDWVSDCDEDESEVRILKSDNVQQKPKQANQPRKVSENPRPVWNNAMRINHQNFSNSRRNFVPTAVLTKSGIVPVINTAKINSVNTAKGNRVTSVVGEQGINVVKSSACWVWRPKINVLDHVSKNSGHYIRKQFDMMLIQQADTSLELKGLYTPTNGYQFTMSNRTTIKKLVIPGIRNGKDSQNRCMADSLLKYYSSN
ncbi:hypothetical protein Tco_0768153 [Tanacetum coccineum]